MFSVRTITIDASIGIAAHNVAERDQAWIDYCTASEDAYAQLRSQPATDQVIGVELSEDNTTLEWRYYTCKDQHITIGDRHVPDRLEVADHLD